MSYFELRVGDSVIERLLLNLVEFILVNLGRRTSCREDFDFFALLCSNSQHSYRPIKCRCSKKMRHSILGHL